MKTTSERIPQLVLDKLGLKTRREFKQYFRKKLKDLDKASMEFLSYSAYLPLEAWITALDASALVDKLKHHLSQKEWGR